MIYWVIVRVPGRRAHADLRGCAGRASRVPGSTEQRQRMTGFLFPPTAFGVGAGSGVRRTFGDRMSIGGPNSAARRGAQTAAGACAGSGFGRIAPRASVARASGGGRRTQGAAPRASVARASGAGGATPAADAVLRLPLTRASVAVAGGESLVGPTSDRQVETPAARRGAQTAAGACAGSGFGRMAPRASVARAYGGGRRTPVAAPRASVARASGGGLRDAGGPTKHSDGH